MSNGLLLPEYMPDNNPAGKTHCGAAGLLDESKEQEPRSYRGRSDQHHAQTYIGPSTMIP
ncbi:MAG: hypothetical protein ACLTDV_07460 [Eubacterium sp.]